MARQRWQPVLDHIRSLAARPDPSASDAELLRRFLTQREEDAFAALVHRHGTMVLRVARRVLGNDADAEDVFQATFLLLSRRAAAIRKREAVAGWLHGVAHRLALSARTKRMRRQEREWQAAETRPTETPTTAAWSELEETLHEALAQLPEKYRTPLVCCYLEGRTQEEAARQLGTPLGTVRSWLARGREMLRKRLLRRGISLSVEGAITALLASACAPADAVPPLLRIATLKAVHLFATGENAMTLLSPSIADLVRQGMTTLFVAKLKSAAAWVLALALLVGGVGWAAHRNFSAKPPEANQSAENAPPPQTAAEERPRSDVFGDPLPTGAVARLGTMRFRHQELRGWQFAVSPDGRSLATVAGRSLILWDMATGRPLRRFSFAEVLHCLTLASDGKSAIIGGEDCIVRRVDLATGKELQRFVGHQVVGDRFAPNKGIWGVVLASEGRKLITWSGDKTVRVWEAHSGKELRRFGDEEFGGKDWLIRGFSPDGKRLMMSKEKSPRMLRLWDLESGKEIRQETYPNYTVGAAISPDNKVLAVAYGEQKNQPAQIVLRDVESGKEIRTTHNKERKWFGQALAFSPDGKTLASAGSGLSQPGSRLLHPCIHFWDVGSMKELRTTPFLRSPSVSAAVEQMAFSPDGKTLVSRGEENHIRLWDTVSGKERIMGEGPSESILSLAYSPNAKLVASASRDQIWLYSAATGKTERVLLTHSERKDFLLAVAFSADGKSLVAVDRDGLLRIWDAETGKERGALQIKTRDPAQAAVAPDGETLAVWNFAPPQSISLWNTRTGEKRRDLGVPPEKPGVVTFPKALLFSADGKILYAASGTHSRILRWDAATGKVLSSLGEHPSSIDGMALSPDGRSLAVVTGGGGTMTRKGLVSWDGELHLWETATGQRRFVVKDVGFATSVAFSPDGNLLALVNAGNVRNIEEKKATTAGIENLEQVRLVRVADGKIVHRFTGHIGGINCVSFSPDGRTVASGGKDTTVLLWDVMDRAVPRAKETLRLKPEKLAELWKGLRGTASESHACMGALIAAPEQAVPFLGEKLKPVAVIDAESFNQLLKKLDSDQFAEREEATRALKELGASAEPALRKALQDKPTLETRRRLQALLNKLEGIERLRTLRAIEVLERIGDKSARALLRRLVQGVAEAWLTGEARATLQRFK